MIKRISNLFPSIGGITGTVIETNVQIHDHGFFPSIEDISILIIVSVIGGTVGYLVKLFWDKIFKIEKK